MIRKYHNHKPQSNQWHREEAPHNHQEDKPSKATSSLSLPRQDDCKTRMDIKIVSEYDQEIPQSQAADNPMAPRGRAAQPSRDTRKTN